MMTASDGPGLLVLVPRRKDYDSSFRSCRTFPDSRGLSEGSDSRLAATRMRCSHGGKKVAEVIAVARPRLRGGGRSPPK
jgi:hypothetical protein